MLGAEGILNVSVKGVRGWVAVGGEGEGEEEGGEGGERAKLRQLKVSIMQLIHQGMYMYVQGSLAIPTSQ